MEPGRERGRGRETARKEETRNRNKRETGTKKLSFPFFSLDPRRHLFFFQQGLSMVAAGVMGLPPTNGVLPQAPMHTHALSVRSDSLLFFLFFYRSRPANEIWAKIKTHYFFSFPNSLFKKPGRRGRAS